MAYEGQARGVVGVVDPIVPVGSRRTREQTLTLVVAYGLHRRPGLARELADFHRGHSAGKHGQM